MTALTMLDTHGTRGNFALLETIAVTNAAATTTVNKGFVPPVGAIAATFVLDMTITGTTPLFDFTLKGVNVAASAAASLTPNTDNAYLIGSGWGAGITQLTTDASSPTVTIHVGPTIAADVTGSATVDSVYGMNCYLPAVMMYTYVYDGTTTDEDYNGTISVYWHGN